MCPTITRRHLHLGSPQARQYVPTQLKSSNVSLTTKVHSALVSLLTRHSQTLSHRASRTHTTLSASDGVAHILKPELSSIVLTLQGLCLIDQRAKDELGQGWMLEVSHALRFGPVLGHADSLYSSSSISFWFCGRKWHQRVRGR